MTLDEVTPARRSAPTAPLAPAIHDEVSAAVANAIRNALQIVQAAILTATSPEPFAQLDRVAIDGVTGQLTGALQLLESPTNPPVRYLTSSEARTRMAKGERPMLARPAANGITCDNCGEALSDHPVEITHPVEQRRRFCVARPVRTGDADDGGRR